MRRGATWGALALVVLCSIASAAPVLVPAPKSLTALPGALDLAGAVVALAGPQSPQADYALEVLRHALPTAGPRKSAVRVTLRLVQSASQLSAAAAALHLPSPPADRWDQAFVLDAGASDPTRITITGGPSGLIYGAYALAHLMATCGQPGGAPRVAVCDWPSLLTRAYTGVPRDPKAPGFAAQLDWLARWRINACYYEIYGDEGQDSAPPEIAEIHRECARRGIALYGQISNWRTERLLKRELCPCNPDDIAHIRRYAEELLDRGCDGLIFLFDDIPQATAEHVLHCEKCRARFHNLAEEQLELVRPMLEVGRQRGVTHFIVCPTAYYQGWQDTYGGKIDGKQYFATWGNSKLLDGVQVYHCLLRRADIAEVQKAGLRNFAYWYNGDYDYESCLPTQPGLAGMWGGVTDMSFGWYAYRWDPALGVVPQPGIYDAFRDLPRLTQHAWLCGGGSYPFALWGSYCWNADRFDPAVTETGLLATLWGAPAAEQYRQWRDITRKWYPRLFAPTHSASADRDVYLRELSADAAAARGSAEAFRSLVAQRQVAGLFVAPPDKDTSADRMLASADAMTQAAKSAASGQSAVRISPVTEQKLDKGVCREQRLEIGNFWSRFALRYSQTTEPDGTRHRTQWHFGSGLGMTGPSYRNWYDAGFIDVLLDGKSLDAYAPEFSSVPGQNGECLLAKWRTDGGEVTLRFSIIEDALRIDGAVAGTGAKLGLRLFTIPSAGSWKDMDKYAVTGVGEVRHGTPVTLQTGDDWLLLADRTYDVPREHAEGPCAVLFGAPVPAVKCDNGEYVVQIDAEYPPETRAFSVAVWDFHGQKNADALAGLKSRLARLRDALKAVQ